MQYSNGIRTQCHVYQYSSLFPVLFLQSLYVPFNSKNFSFTCVIKNPEYYDNTHCIEMAPNEEEPSQLREDSELDYENEGLEIEWTTSS